MFEHDTHKHRYIADDDIYERKMKGVFVLCPVFHFPVCIMCHQFQPLEYKNLIFGIHLEHRDEL